MTSEEFIKRIENCKDNKELLELLDIAIERAEKRLEKYKKYLHKEIK